jgi:YD repeat-containing protein
MKKLMGMLLASVALAVACPASTYAEPQTQSRTLYDARGQEIGRSITRGNTTVHKDAMGREIGRSERRGDGTTNYYDALGRSLGSSRSDRPPVRGGQ